MSQAHPHEPVDLLTDTVAAIMPPDQAAMAATRDHQARMTKPAGSLGALEELSVRLAGLAGHCPPPLPEPAAVAVFAADHGVHAQRVTPWPQEVTAQMVRNFLAGGAVVNAFAAQCGAQVVVVDVGVNAELEPGPGLLSRKVGRGTADFTAGPAMSGDEAAAGLRVGVRVGQGPLHGVGVAVTVGLAVGVAACQGRVELRSLDVRFAQLLGGADPVGVLG